MTGKAAMRKCPKCGNGNLVVEGGCQKCRECGWAKC